MKDIKNITKEDLIEYLKAIGCIGIGTLVGIFSYWLCLVLHLAIFGWNIGLVLAPLIAGYVETYLARRYLQETTGAISAFILFLVTVVYGFIITNPTLGHNLITLGASGIIIQAAIPTLVNYFLIVLIVSIASYTLGFVKTFKKYAYIIYGKLYHKFTGKIYEPPIENKPVLIRENIDIDDLGILFLTSANMDNILEYKGIYECSEFLKYDEKEIIKLDNPEDGNKLLIEDIRYTKDKTLLKLANNLKNDGCNGILGIDIQYDTVKKGGVELIIQVSISGTGIVIK